MIAVLSFHIYKSESFHFNALCKAMGTPVPIQCNDRWGYLQHVGGVSGRGLLYGRVLQCVDHKQVELV